MYSVSFVLAFGALVAGCAEKAPDTSSVQDAASTISHVFDCGAAGTASMRFLGPDTIELNIGDALHVLQHQPAASGAKYVNDQVLFWNKGDEALLEMTGQREACTRMN